ncbi:hypothetical protein, partial [Bacteroides caccae]|uniref:hypothetical protein n=1 Tax=Bacteroides caccae TaxID=47678 RepID=UPI0022AADFB6
YFLKKQARSPILEGFGRNIYALLSFSGQQYKIIDFIQESLYIGLWKFFASFSVVLFRKK